MGINMKRVILAAGLGIAAVAAPARAQTVVNADRAQITEKATIGGSTFGEVLRVLGVGPVSGGSGTMNPWVLDANGDVRKDTTTTVGTAGLWTFGTSPRVSSSSPWLDWHENDAATDEKFMRWISEAGIFRLQSVNDAYSAATDLLSVDRAGVNATMSVAMPTIFSVSGTSLNLTASGVDNARLGVNTGTPRVILEDAGSPFQIQMDNLTGIFRVARLTQAGNCEAIGCVPFAIDDAVRFAPKGAAVLPIAPYGFSIGSPLLPIHALYAGELNVQQLVSHEKMITQGARLGIARSTTLLEGIGSATGTIKTKHNNINIGDRLWFEADGRFEFMAVTGGPTRINRCQANCDGDNGTTYWATTTTTLTWQREQRWQGEGAIQVAAVAVGDAYQTNAENFVPSTAYTVSLYIRRADAGVITPGPTAYVLFCGSFTGVQANAVSVGAGWYRLYANCTSPASPNQAVGVTWLPNVVHYIDAVQIEPGSTLTDWSESASQYTVTRDLDGSGPTPWEAGAGILDTGSIGTAWIDAYAESSIRGKFNYGSKVLELNPAGYWRFGTYGFADSSINNTTWTMVGSAIGAHSGVGGATFDSQGGAYQAGTGYLTIPDAAHYKIIGDLTIELFLYWPSDTTGIIVAKGHSARGEYDLHWIAGSGGHLRYAHGNGSTNTAIVEACTNGSIPLSTWTHVAIVRDTANLQILCYINGALNQRVAYSTTPAATADSLAAFARPDGSFPGPASKHIDDLAIYPRMLSADDIKEHYDARLRTLPETQYGPTVVGNMRYGNTWNEWRPFWALGNLSGTYDYTQHTYGFAAGDPTKTWTSIDATKGFRLMQGSLNRMQLDASSLTFYAPNDGALAMQLATSGATPYIHIGRAIANSPQLFITDSYMQFCQYGQPCKLTFDGANGNITSAGNIYLTTGGNIESAGEWNLTKGNGLRINRSVTVGAYNAAYALSMGQAATGYNDFQLFTLNSGIVNMWKPSGDLIIGDFSVGSYYGNTSNVIIHNDGNTTSAADLRSTTLTVGVDGVVFNFHKGPGATAANTDRIRPHQDALMSLGSPSQRWKNIHLALGFTTTQNFVVVGDPNDTTSLAAAQGVTASVVIGSCTLNLRAGLVMSKSGC